MQNTSLPELTQEQVQNLISCLKQEKKYACRAYEERDYCPDDALSDGFYLALYALEKLYKLRNNYGYDED